MTILSALNDHDLAIADLIEMYEGDNTENAREVSELREKLKFQQKETRALQGRVEQIPTLVAENTALKEKVAQLEKLLNEATAKARSMDAAVSKENEELRQRNAAQTKNNAHEMESFLKKAQEAIRK